MAGNTTRQLDVTRRDLLAAAGAGVVGAAFLASPAAAQDAPKKLQYITDENPLEPNKTHAALPYNIIVAARIEVVNTGDSGEILGIVYIGPQKLTVASASVSWSDVNLQKVAVKHNSFAMVVPAFSTFQVRHKGVGNVYINRVGPI